MKKALVTILQYVLFLGLGIYIIYHMVHELTDEQQTQLITAIKSVNIVYLIPIAIIGTLSHYFRALRWRYLLETIDLHPTAINTMFAVMIGYVANLVFPRAGEVAKCTVLAKYEQMPAHKMVGTIVAERAFDVLCLGIITCFAFIVEFKRINFYITDKVGNLNDKLIANQQLLITVAAVGLGISVLIYILLKKNKDSKIVKLINELIHGIFSIFRMKKKWQFLGYSVLIWFLYALQLYLGLLSLPATAHLSFMSSIVVLAYGSFGIIATPGGIGAYTYLVAQILGAYNIADIPAQAFGWIAWAMQTVLIIVLGILSLLLIHPYNKKRNVQAGMDNPKDS